MFAKSGAVVDAIDISPKSVSNQKAIAEIAGLNINAVVMDAHKLDLPTNHYDIVYGNAILHHLSIKEAASEIYRVLKPGGRGIFRDVMKGNLFLRAFRFATPFWRTDDEHPLIKKDFAELNKSFSNTQIDYYVLSGLPYIFSVRIMNVILRKLGFKLPLETSANIYNIADKFDCLLFRIFPLLKRQAWICLIVMTK